MVAFGQPRKKSIYQNGRVRQLISSKNLILVRIKAVNFGWGGEEGEERTERMDNVCLGYAARRNHRIDQRSFSFHFYKKKDLSNVKIIFDAWSF